MFSNDLIGSNTIFIFREFFSLLKVKVSFSFSVDGKILAYNLEIMMSLLCFRINKKTEFFQRKKD